MEKQADFQQLFLQEVEKRVPPNQQLAKYLVNSLGIKKSNAYRRISGETQFTWPQVAKLAQELHISLDVMLNQDQREMVMFKLHPYINSIEKVREYFSNTLSSLRMLKRMEDVELFWTARDLPIFYFLSHPILCRFKAFVWLGGAESHTLLDQGNFQFNRIDDETVALGMKVGKAYAEISSTEIWKESSLENVLEQIRDYYEAGSITKETAFQLCHELSEVLENLHEATVNGYREDFPAGHFNLYSSSYLLAENNAIARVRNKHIGFIPYASINFMQTENEAFCARALNWYNDQKKKAILLRTASAGIRNRFFSQFFKQVENLKKRIEWDSED